MKGVSPITIATVLAAIFLVTGILTFHSIHSTNTDAVMGNKRTAGMFFFMLGIAFLVWVIAHYYFVTIPMSRKPKILTSNPSLRFENRFAPPPDSELITEYPPGFGR